MMTTTTCLHSIHSPSCNISIRPSSVEGLPIFSYCKISEDVLPCYTQSFSSSS